MVLFWQLCALLVRAEPKERRGNALALLQDLMQAMGLSATHKAQVVTIVKQVLAGKELPLPELVAALAQSVSHHPVTLDFVFELLVTVALASGTLNPTVLKLLLTCAPRMAVDKVRLQYLVQLRQHELSLAHKFQGKPLAYRAYSLPQLMTHHRGPPLAHEATELLTAAARAARYRPNPAQLSYACDLLALERNFTLEQAAAATQLLVLRYAPVQLERAHMPRALIRLAQKKVADAIGAFNLLRQS